MKEMAQILFFSKDFSDSDAYTILFFSKAILSII
jgi:hypothetical protein